LSSATNLVSADSQTTNKQIKDVNDKDILISKPAITPYNCTSSLSYIGGSKELNNIVSLCNVNDDYPEKHYTSMIRHSKPLVLQNKKILEDNQISRIDQTRSWVDKSNRLGQQISCYSQIQNYPENASEKRLPKVWNNIKPYRNDKCDKLSSKSGVLDLSFRNMSPSLFLNYQADPQDISSALAEALPMMEKRE